MKRIHLLSYVRRDLSRLVIGAFLLVAPISHAFTYNDQDLLLIFHKDGFDDIEYNLGSVTPLLSLAPGSSQVLSNWNADLLTATYGNDLSDGVKVLLLAVTGLSPTANRHAWVTSSDLINLGSDRTPSQWQSIWSKINGIGTQPQIYTQTSNVPYFVAAPSLIASFTYIASNAGSQSSLLPTLGGTSAFPVETAIPGELRFLDVAPSTLNPKPQATLLGTFQIDASGALTFTAGNGTSIPTATRITNWSATSGNLVLTFDTVSGVKYRLVYTDELGGGVWTISDQLLVGTGSPGSLTNSVSGAARFFAIEAY